LLKQQKNYLIKQSLLKEEWIDNIKYMSPRPRYNHIELQGELYLQLIARGSLRSPQAPRRYRKLPGTSLNMCYSVIFVFGEAF
jgi:hypothetical protein